MRYDCDTTALGPALASRFLELGPDEAQRSFLAGAPHSRARLVAFGWFRRWMTDYSAYGYLGMYAMHLLSLPQWRAFLAGAEGAGVLARDGVLLDVGAGRGDSTQLLLPLFSRAWAVEPAAPLRRTLQKRGFAPLLLDPCLEPFPDNVRADLVTCLNVLDRVSHPCSLLKHVHSVLGERGRLVVSVPLPLRPHVDRGRETVDPEELLPSVDGDSFEEHARSLAQEVLAVAGWSVLRLTRVPYLCQGDSLHRYHALDSVVFLCEPTPAPGQLAP